MKKNLSDQQKIVKDVFDKYIEIFECPCGWPQFNYWVSKQQGPGWQDGIQNDLVDITLQLPFFRSVPPIKPEYWLVAEVHCDHCGAKWQHFSIEWRMLAFQQRLIRLDKDCLDLEEFPDLMISESIYATVGHEPPAEIPRLTTGEWVKFMQG